MKKLFALSILTLFSLTSIGVEYAEAKRFGMGSSFGKQRMSKPPVQQRNLSQQKATPSKAANTQRGSARTGMMGMIGGLALGGLLGAMFFGGGFEGINFFDILIFGALAFLLIKLMGNKARRSQPMAFAGDQPDREAGQQGSFDLFGSGSENGSAQTTVQGHAVTPEIDTTFFLNAARDIFIRMQAAWDKKDMDAIRSFATDEVANRIEMELSGLADKTTQTEVATLNAEIMDSWVESNLEWVAVHFTAMIKEQESGAEDVTHEVQEHWIFQHDPSSDDPTWYLAGIQQG